MVGVLTRRCTVYALLVVVIGVVTWLLLPRMTAEIVYPYSSILRDAIVSYRDEKGRFAGSLVDVEPYVEMLTRMDCVITEEGQSDYHVKMPLGDGKTYYLKVTYLVNDDGEWEDFNVYLIDGERTP